MIKLCILTQSESYHLILQYYFIIYKFKDDIIASKRNYANND